jgi:exodeoxyribonuclease-5
MLNTLASEAPALTSDENKQLYEALQEHYALDEPDQRRRNGLIKKDAYYNAMQVKFSYAVTCHKAQGGQWPVVFVDQGFLNEEMLGTSYLRWLYTAFTRAS